MGNRALASVATTAAKAPGLDLLVLFGSRARGDVHIRSDWDLGYLASAAFDPDALLAFLVAETASDKVDLVDLSRAGGLLRYRAARDGQIVFEREPQIFARFWLEAVDFWCDAAPLIRRGYDRVLADIARMSPPDRDVLAERTMAVERHLARVAERLPRDAADFKPTTDASDAVVLHLWQATQIVIDLAMSACLRFDAGAPSSHADAFARLHRAGVIDQPLTNRLSRAAGFRNVVAHAYDTLDLARVFRAAMEGPADLRRFLAVLRDRLSADT